MTGITQTSRVESARFNFNPFFSGVLLKLSHYPIHIQVVSHIQVISVSHNGISVSHTQVQVTPLPMMVPKLSQYKVTPLPTMVPEWLQYELTTPLPTMGPQMVTV